MKEIQTNAISDVLFAPTIKAIYVHFRKLIKCKAVQKSKKRKYKLTTKRKLVLVLCLVFSSSLIYAFVSFRQTHIVQTVWCLAFVTCDCLIMTCADAVILVRSEFHL